MPAGLTLNSETGEVSGVRQQSGCIEVTFQVTDACRNSRTKTFALSINDIMLQWTRTYDGGLR